MKYTYFLIFSCVAVYAQEPFDRHKEEKDFHQLQEEVAALIIKASNHNATLDRQRLDELKNEITSKNRKVYFCNIDSKKTYFVSSRLECWLTKGDDAEQCQQFKHFLDDTAFAQWDKL